MTLCCVLWRDMEAGEVEKKTICFSFLIVSLGSIPEMPAETCKEIKDSEGGQAFSGKYWFDSILAGQVVFAFCDMETEGKLISWKTCLTPRPLNENIMDSDFDGHRAIY